MTEGGSPDISLTQYSGFLNGTQYECIHSTEKILLHRTQKSNTLKGAIFIKGNMSDSFTNYNYVGNTKVSVSIKKTYANKCTLSEIFLTEILKSFSVF